MKYSLIFFFSLLCYNCTTSLSDKELEGNWHWVGYGDGVPFVSFQITNNQIYTVNYNCFAQSHGYRIRNNSIEIGDLKSSETFMVSLITDSTLTLNDTVRYEKFILKDDVGYHKEIQAQHKAPYQLAGIRTEERLDYSKYRYSFIQYYRNNDGDLRLQMGCKLVAFSDFCLFCEVHCGPLKRHAVVFFVGQDLSLRDLKKLYKYISFCGSGFEVALVTAIDGFDQYHILKDYSFSWYDDFSLEEYDAYGLPPPPPPPLIAPNDPLKNRLNYLKSGAELISIINPEDQIKLESLISDQKYLISIDANLRIEEYLQIIQFIGTIGRHNIKVEILTEENQ